MTTKNFKPEDYEERLPSFYRTIKLPTELWEAVKECGDQEKKALRWIVDEVLDAEHSAIDRITSQAWFEG